MTPWPAARICPAPPRQSGVPAQQSSRGNDQAQLAELTAGQQPGQCGHDRPVRPRQHRFVDLALEHRELMPQEQDLRVLGAARESREQRSPLYEIDWPVDMTARITSRQVVHGLISEYRRAG